MTTLSQIKARLDAWNLADANLFPIGEARFLLSEVERLTAQAGKKEQALIELCRYTVDPSNVQKSFPTYGYTVLGIASAALEKGEGV